MDKGIRPEARNKFVELNELRRRNMEPFVGPKANTLFRAAVIEHLKSEFLITLASAATHYNEAFKFVKDLNPELVDGLGRAEDKKGGRKPKAKPEAAPAAADPNSELDPGDPVQTEFTVKKKADGSVVAEGLSFEDAKALVQKAAASKKAKLYWV